MANDWDVVEAYLTKSDMEKPAHAEALAALARLKGEAERKEPREATEFLGYSETFASFKLADGGRVHIPADQIRRLWNAEQALAEGKQEERCSER